MNRTYTAEEYVEIINSALYGYIEQNGSETDRVAQAMLYSLKNGGKRVRPMLLLEFCRACSGDINAALPLACALEMVHTYSLIHDDLPCMDNDDYRRGKPSCHKQFDYATALLAGDGLLTLAFSVAAKAELKTEALLKAIAVLADCAGYLGMIGGQTLDLQHEGQAVCLEKLRLTDSLKTGRLINAACTLGCITANADEEKISAAAKYAENIGLAFQIVDDLLDITSTTELLGKPVGSDEQSEKATYPALLGLEESRTLVNQLTKNAVESLSIFGSEAEFLCGYAQKLAERKK